jgi:O-antigen ligase
VTVLMMGLGVHVLVGVGQVVFQRPLGLPGELALAPDRSGAAIVQVAGARWLRAYGLTFHPNVLGGFLVVGLILGLAVLTRPPLLILWWLLWLGLLLSFSRSAWLAASMGLPVAVGWIAHRQPSLRRILTITCTGAALIGLLWAALFGGQLLTRLRPQSAPTEYRSIVERGALQTVALDVVKGHPLTGVGAGNFSLALLATGFEWPAQPVHNLPLLMTAELGVLGGVLWLWLWLAPGVALTRRWNDAHPRAIVLVTAWLALGVIGLWDHYPWALNAGRLLSATLLGLIGRVARDGGLTDRGSTIRLQAPQ